MNPGQEVFWVSQSQGTTTKKRGRVVGTVGRSKSAFNLLPEGLPKSRIKFQEFNLTGTRVIVEVPRGGKSKLSDFYAPYASMIKLVEDTSE